MNDFLEVFYSIQGEGLRIGVPSVFVRFPGCNLKCPWCDTKYSWDEQPTKNMKDVKQVVNSSQAHDLVITGGEPLLKPDLILQLRREFPDLKLTVETNGSMDPMVLVDKLTIQDDFILWSVSPKLFLNDWDKYVKTFDNFKEVQFKFVIDTLNKDIDKIQSLTLNHPIIVQPNGQKENYQKSCQELAEKVLSRKLNFRVLPQFHKICWGDQRGI